MRVEFRDLERKKYKYLAFYVIEIMFLRSKLSFSFHFLRRYNIF